MKKPCSFFETVKRKKQLHLVVIGGLFCLLMASSVNKIIPVMNNGSLKEEYVILAANDLGMHCMQKDYSSFLILPPANNIRVQVIQKGGKSGGKLINKGIKVLYEIIDNTTSWEKNNFWEYAKDYGYQVEKDIGITGNGLSGSMVLSQDNKYYEATAIPVTPYTDSNPTKLEPYQLAKITVIDEKTNQTLGVTDSVVVPVSDELDCGECHGKEDTNLNILKAHDKNSGTELVKELANNVRHKCSDCHQDNALGEKGKEGVKPLSEAMHGFHDTKMELSSIKPSCYSCHPGPITKCNRGQMSVYQITCDNEDCHGTMNQVATSQAEGRQAWLEEPDCGNCHSAKYASNKNTLYKNSYLQNAPGKDMNNLIRCQSCHNSTHGEWKSTLPLDNKLPESLMGHDGFISECSVCHEGKGKVHQKE